MMKLLHLSSVWPEPRASAAGFRVRNLVDAALREGWQVVCASTGRLNEHVAELEALGISTAPMQPNDPAFDSWVRAIDPDIVIMDRFIIEEQFGWRVEESCPRALRVLDTVDLHFLRRSRGDQLPLVNETTLREVASIYRSDCAMVISSYEFELLVNEFGVPREQLMLTRLFYPAHAAAPAFSERRDFTMIGNFRHPPNLDAVKWLNQEVWPLIRARLPGAEVHLYGAYPSREAVDLDDERSGFRVRGFCPDQFEMFGQYRVNLAPLRFGAGIKGKITDGWFRGTPNVTTPIGAEGMADGLEWGGLIGTSAGEIADAAVLLHEEERRWKEASQNGYRIMGEFYDTALNSAGWIGRLKQIASQRESMRARNFTGRMLNHHLHRSTSYLSKWIELKNRSNPHAGIPVAKTDQHETHS